jgi:energy-coupling factor transporter ATP-binding protein EcfA2
MGRRHVFETIMSELAGPKSELILITGPAGSGRTYLLRHVAAAARHLGYQVLTGTDAEPSTIEPSTTIADVQRRVEKFTNSTPRDSGPALEPPSRPSGQVEAKRIAGILRQLAPLLVVIDGFRPASAFQAWFTDLLIPQLWGRSERVSAVVADRAEELEPLARYAALAVDLGPLDSDEARVHLREAAQGLSPELTTDELERYVAATVAEPGQFAALLAVFEACGPRHPGIIP